MTKKRKNQKKAESVNIPVDQPVKAKLHNMAMGSFESLLHEVLKPEFNSEGSLNKPKADTDVAIIAKILREEDAQKQRQKREKMKKIKSASDNRSTSVSPTCTPAMRRSIEEGCFTAPTDDIGYIDGGEGDSHEDVEMDDLSNSSAIRLVPVQLYHRGNEEKICDDLTDYETNRDDVYSPVYNNNILTDPILPAIPKEQKKIQLPPAQPQETKEIKDNKKIDEAKKRRLLNQKKKAIENTYTVQKVTIPRCMCPNVLEGDYCINHLLDYIEPGQGVKKDDCDERRRKTKENKKNIISTVTIGNTQNKAPAAAPTKPQDIKASNMNKDGNGNKKSPNKKNKKSGNTSAVANTMSRIATGRMFTEDGEEEFLSADEGIVSSNSDENNVAKASDLMMDGANYRADTDDISCLDNHVVEEQEFITVESRDKKKKNQTQTQRTGSTGKFESRNNSKNDQQQRRNSLDDRPKNRPRPQTALCLGDFEKKPETHTKAKIVPFKEGKKKHERLESAADSEYMDANDEMVIPNLMQNGSMPERSFSYADAAKKSAEQSRENSPACTDAAATSRTPSPPPSVECPPRLVKDNNNDSLRSAPIPIIAKDDSCGLSFYFEEGNGNEEMSLSHEDGAFVLNLPGKTVRFAKGMAAPISLQPVDDHHRTMVELMMNRWKAFTQGPVAPVYYSPNLPV